MPNNTTKYFSLLVLLFYWIELYGQTSPVKTLSFLESSSPIISRSNNVDESKFQKAKKIYLQLVQQKGDYRTPVPKFSMNKNQAKVAEIKYEGPEIVFEEKAFDICQEIGDEAIAFLLAHELTHYYEKHGWKNEFESNFDDLAIGSKIKAMENQIINETQADYLGGFLAYLSGYGLNFKADSLLTKLYDEYKIDPGMSKSYPSLVDRIALNKRSSSKLQVFAELYETANYLLMAGYYKEAINYYQYILLRYQSNKLYNNLGLALVLQAKQFFNPTELKYEYPLELDNQPISERDASTLKLRDSLLNAAIISFDISLGMDPGYLPAKLNKAICFSLLNEHKRALYYCEEEIAIHKDTSSYSKTLIDNLVLIGILYDFLGDAKNAKLNFEKAIQKGSEIGKLNFKIFNKKAELSTSINSSIEEEWAKINGTDLKEFANGPQFDDEKIIEINSAYTFYQSKTDSLNYKIFFNYNKGTSLVQYFMVIRPGSGITTTNKKIGEGSTKDDLLKAYGNPINSIETTQGSLYIYKRMFFNIGKSNKVESWGNFMSKEFN